MIKGKTLAVIMLIAVTGAAPVYAETKYVNSRDGLRVRDKPSEKGKTIDVVPYGAAVSTVDDTILNGWYRIEHGNLAAYISSEFTQDENPLAEMTHMGKWRITAYAYTGSPCANGNFPQEEYTIACNSLPFGTEVFISGVGFRTVEDRGPAGMGDEWLDLYLGNTDACVQWGDQYLDVYVVEEEEGK